MSLKLPLSRLLFLGLTLAVFGACVHIGIILLLPQVSQGDAWSRLDGLSKLNELAILPDAESKNRPIAFMAPDVRYAACRYDLSNGPLQLRSPLPNDLWSIALYTHAGENYYLISGRNVQSREVNLIVVLGRSSKEDDDKNEQAQDNKRNAAIHDITVSAPTEKGIILIRAPLPTPAYAEQVSERLNLAFCRPVTFARQADAGR